MNQYAMFFDWLAGMCGIPKHIVTYKSATVADILR